MSDMPLQYEKSKTSHISINFYSKDKCVLENITNNISSSLQISENEIKLTFTLKTYEILSDFIFDSIAIALNVLTQLPPPLENIKIRISINYEYENEQYGEDFYLHNYVAIKENLQKLGVYNKIIELNPLIHITLSKDKRISSKKRTPEWHIYTQKADKDANLDGFEKLCNDTTTVYIKRISSNKLKETFSMNELNKMMSICDELQKDHIVTNTNLQFFNYCDQDTIDFNIRDLEKISTKKYLVTLKLLDF